MNKLFAGLLLQYREFFKNLGPTKRVSVIVVTFIAVIAVISMFFIISGKDYVPLLTQIPSEQMPLIVQKLNEKNVPFRLNEDGKLSVFPKKYSTRLK